MKLIGKRTERLNSFGDSLAIQLKDEGQMRLSPALMSRLKVTVGNNKIGIAYPEEGEKDLHIYVAPDGDGVAVNKQGYIKNIPHNRDLRSHMDLSSTGEEDLYICEEAIQLNEHPGYTFYKIVLDTYDEWDNVEIDDDMVDDRDDIQEEETVEDHTDDSQEVEETDNEIATEDKENDEKFEDFDLI